MKKIFLFAAAAMVSLSSCVQTNEVYTGGLQEIGFKSAVTKAAIDGTNFEGSMTVAAVWDAEEDGSYVEYFAPHEFAGTASTPWAGQPAKYWPNDGKMQFIACYPYGIGTFAADYAGDVLAGYTVTDIENKGDQNDVLYSNLLTCDAPQSDAQALLFHHALSLLKVTFATNLPAAQVVKIESVSVADVVFDGDLTVTAGNPSTAAWSEDGTPEDYTFQGVDTTNQLTATPDEDAIPLLILPSKTGEKQTSMTIVYTLNGHQMTKTVPLADYGAWEMGKKYIYNFTIGAKEIKFTCTVDTWTDVPVGGAITI